MTTVVAKNASGQPTKIRDANLIDTDMTYDERNRLKTTTIAGATTTYAYDAAGNVTRITRGDVGYRLATLKVKNTSVDVISLAYAYGDGANAQANDGINLTAINDLVTPANNQSLWYTGLGRLQNASGIYGSYTFTVDGVGNRTQEVKTLSGTTTTKVLAYPATSNRLSSETTNGTLSRSFTYDGAGNLLTGLPAGATYSFTYDQRNRPHWLRLNGTVVGTYLFNGLEQLSSRIIAAPLSPAGTTHYIYDLDGHLIAEAFGTSASTAVIVREYIWLEGMPVMAIDGVNTATPTLMAVHVDHLGRPIRMTNTTKNQVWNALWTPFGTAHSITGSATQNLRFPGQYFLIEQGMHYNWHRFYDATTGRYTQPDPLGFVDGPSRYAYALNSPLMFIDEDGHTSRVRPGIPIPAPLPQSKPVDKWGYPLAKYCPPPPPGDCDPDTQRRLQDDVNYACKQPRKCTQGMSSSELTTNMIRNRSCGNARNLINKKCFRGGDAEHREEADNAFHSLAKCESLISSASQ